MMNEIKNNAENKKSSAFIPQKAGGDLGVVRLSSMEIKVLGTGCAKCKLLEKATREAVAEAGINATVTKIEDIVEIMNYGIMTTPALVINDKVVVKGRVPSKDEIKKLINS